MMTMMMMMNRFCGMVDRRMAFSLISTRNYSQRFSASRISNRPRTGVQPASAAFFEWSCVAVITTKLKSIRSFSCFTLKILSK